MTNKRIVYLTFDCNNAARDLNTVIESANVRPVGLCCDGSGAATHIVLSRDDYLALIGVRNKWLEAELSEPETLAEITGAASAL